MRDAQAIEAVTVGVEGERTLLGRPSTFVGREAELAMLASILRGVEADRSPHAALVIGEAGIGKSRLCHELLRRLPPSEAREVWIGRGEPMREGSAFGVIGSALRRAAGIDATDPDFAQRRKLLARAGRRLLPLEAERITEFLGELAGVPFDEATSVRLSASRRDAALMRDQLRRAWEDFIEAECSDQTIVLVLEDLHWGDVPSVRLVEAALRRDGPLFVIVLARPEVRTRFTELFAGCPVTEIVLDQLPAESAERIVRDALGKRASVPLVTQIVARAEGNPFFLEELVRGAAEGRSNEMPASVVAMWSARMAALDPLSRAALAAASVFGKVFDRASVEALAGAEASATLDALEAEEIIHLRGEGAPAGSYAFRHAIVREAAYATLSPEERARLHGLTAERLIEAGELDARLLAEHLERAGHPDRALGCYYRAALHALEGNDTEGALVCAERALACGAVGTIRAELLLVRAEVNRWRDRNVEAQRDAAAAIEALRPGSSGWCAAVSELAACALKLGDPAALERIAVVLRELLASTKMTVPAQIIACARVAAPLLLFGRMETARELLRTIDTVSDAVKSAPLVRARVRETLAIQAFCEGDPGGAIEHSAQAIRAFGEVFDLRSQAVLQSNTGVALASIGAIDEAEVALRSAIAAGERLSLPQIVCAGRQNLGYILAQKGDVDAGMSLIARSIRDAIVQQNRRLEVGARTYLALAAKLAGKLRVAEAEADAAAKMAGSGAAQQAYALGVLASVLAAEGRAQEASAFAEQAMAIVDRLGGAIEEGEATVRLARVETLLAIGDHGAAKAALTKAIARLVERAATIGEERSAGFFERVPEHRALRALAHQLGVSPGAPPSAA